MKGKAKKDFFSFKNDDKDLVELGQFLRDTTKYKVEREWFVIFEKKSGKFLGYQKTFNGNPLHKPRCPDLMLIDKKTKKLILVIELDGDIHRIKETDTEARNEQYKKAGIPMLVISTWEIQTTIFDHVSKKLTERMV